MCIVLLDLVFRLTRNRVSDQPSSCACIILDYRRELYQRALASP
jgi:hypothetical protein